MDEAELQDVKALPDQGAAVEEGPEREKLARFKGIASGAMDQLLGFVSYQSGLLARGGQLDETALAQAHSITYVRSPPHCALCFSLSLSLPPSVPQPFVV